MLCSGATDITYVPNPKELQTETMHFIQHRMPCFKPSLVCCPYRDNDMQVYPCLSAISVDDVWQLFEKVVEPLVSLIPA